MPPSWAAARRPNTFAELSSCASAASIYTLLGGINFLDAKLASHALHCLGKAVKAEEELQAAAIVKLLRALGVGVRRGDRLQPKELSKAAWGLGKLWPCCSGAPEVRDAALLALDGLASQASQVAETLDAQAAATILHAHGTVGSAPKALAMRALQRRLAALASSTQCAPQDIANVLWAMARVGAVVDPSLVSALDTALPPSLLARFKPMELSSTAWALAKLQAALYPPEELSRLMQSIHTALAESGANGGEASGGGGGKGGGGGGGALLRGLSAQGAANCLWAFARVEPPPPRQLVCSLVGQAARRAIDLTQQGLANVCSACARLDAPAEECLQLLDRQGVVEALAAGDVAEVAWAVGRMHLATANGGGGSSGSGSNESSSDSSSSGGSNSHGNGAAGSVGETSASGRQQTMLSRVALALWRRAKMVVSQLGWQECAHLEFAMRVLRSASAADAEARAVLAPLLAAAASEAVATVKRERAMLETAALDALLEAQPAPWVSLPRGTTALLMGVGSAGGACTALTDALTARGLALSYWNRFADGRLPESCPPACTWPSAAPGSPGGYGAVLLRLPSSKPALEYALHAAASVLRAGGLLVLFGCRVEGVHSTHGNVTALQLFYDVAELPAAPSSACSMASGTAPAIAMVLTARRSSSAPSRVGADSFEQRTTLQLPSPPSTQPPATTPAAITPPAIAPPSLPWVTLPGLFAGGGLDVMTAVLLRALPPPPPRARVLDFCAGSGVIGAAILAREASVRLQLLDADALAVHASRHNLAAAAHAPAVLLSDGWDGLPKRPRFDWIVSNPPVHLGLQNDFRVLRVLIAGAAKRLKVGGQLWIVAQTYVPVGALLRRQSKLVQSAACFDDGRFTVWTATRGPRGRADKKAAGIKLRVEAAAAEPRKRKRRESEAEEVEADATSAAEREGKAQRSNSY